MSLGFQLPNTRAGLVRNVVGVLEFTSVPLEAGGKTRPAH